MSPNQVKMTGLVTHTLSIAPEYDPYIPGDSPLTPDALLSYVYPYDYTGPTALGDSKSGQPVAIVPETKDRLKCEGKKDHKISHDGGVFVEGTPSPFTPYDDAINQRFIIAD